MWILFVLGKHTHEQKSQATTEQRGDNGNYQHMITHIHKRLVLKRQYWSVDGLISWRRHNEQTIDREIVYASDAAACLDEEQVVDGLWQVDWVRGWTCDWSVLTNQACEVAEELAERRSLHWSQVPAGPDNILEKKEGMNRMWGEYCISETF